MKQVVGKGLEGGDNERKGEHIASLTLSLPKPNLLYDSFCSAIVSREFN